MLFSSLLAGVVLTSAEPLYRNRAYTSPQLGSQLSTWIFSDWSYDENDPTFNPSHSPSVSLPLYGSVHMTAYWFADVKLGTPVAQVQSLIADTGSSVMGFPCADCTSCGRHVDAAFDLSKTKTAKYLNCGAGCPLCSTSLNEEAGQCAYHIRYTEGSSLVGKWYTDKVWLERDPFATGSKKEDGALFELPFGCHTEETHLFLSQEATGILGLEGTSRFGPPPFATAVLADLFGMTRARTGGVSRNLQIIGKPRTSRTKPVLSLCLSSSGGILTVGGINSKYHVRPATEEMLRSFFEINRKPTTVQLRPTTRPARAITSDRFGTYNWNRYLNEDKCDDLSMGPTTQRSLQEENVLRTSTHHYDPLPPGLQWTPLVLDTDEEGGWPGSYVAVIQNAYVRGAAGTTQLQVPFTPGPLSIRDGLASGLPALVDSGTTLTYLPFMFYANLWAALLRNVVAEKDKTMGRRLSKNSGVVRVSGVPVEAMADKVARYRDALASEEVSLRRARQMSKVHPDDTSDIMAKRLEYLKNEIENARSVLDELSKLNEKLEVQAPQDVMYGEEVWQELDSIEDSAPPRKLPGRGYNIANTTDDDNNNIVLFPDSDPLMHLVPEDHSDNKRRLSPVALPNLDEECWYFANIANDVKYFPDIKIVFANNAEYIWRPSSFLYRKGKTRVFCLTIIADKNGEDMRLLGPDGGARQAVLGSSFFIDHDLVFHLGNWGLGFAEAQCPTTDLRKRLKRS